MDDQRSLKSGDAPFLVGVAVTLALAAGVILGVHRSSIPASANPKIDPVKIQQLIDQGKISGRPAEYFEEIPSK